MDINTFAVCWISTLCFLLFTGVSTYAVGWMGTVCFLYVLFPVQIVF